MFSLTPISTKFCMFNVMATVLNRSLLRTKIYYRSVTISGQIFVPDKFLSLIIFRNKFVLQ